MTRLASKVVVLLVVASALTMTGGYGTTASYLSDTETASGSIDVATGGDITIEKITPKKINAKSNGKFTVHLDISGDASVRCGETTLRVLKTGDTITSLNQACDSSNAKFSRAALADAVNGSGKYRVRVTVTFESGFTVSATTTLRVKHASPGTQTVEGTNTGDDDSGFTEEESDEPGVVENETNRRNKTTDDESKRIGRGRNASENTLNESESLENDSTPLENESESLENDTKSGDAGNESANAGEDADDGSTDGNADGGETRGENDGSGADAGDADADESEGEGDDEGGEEPKEGSGAGSEDDGDGGGEQSGGDTERDDDDGGGGAS
ncbi:hypothetical protein U3A55_13500 [Salarchaeum sp. III]|uniref:hypothetical protein n=1 Tax=Salarchaeum sp. III TaxID=3107927 RepID=UPI002ED92080